MTAFAILAMFFLDFVSYSKFLSVRFETSGSLIDLFDSKILRSGFFVTSAQIDRGIVYSSSWISTNKSKLSKIVSIVKNCPKRQKL